MMQCISFCSTCVCLHNTCSHEHACVSKQSRASSKAKVVFSAHVCIHMHALFIIKVCACACAIHVSVMHSNQEQKQHQPKTHEARYPRSICTSNQTRKPWHLHPHAETHTPVHTCTHPHALTCIHTHPKQHNHILILSPNPTCKHTHTHSQLKAF